MKQENDQIKDKIKNFYDAPVNKALIGKYLHESFFDVIGKNRSESAHTNFLKWFFSQKEWYEKALTCFLKLIIKKLQSHHLYSGKEQLVSIDWENCEIRLWGENPLQSEYPCVCRVNDKKQTVRVDLVMNLEVKDEWLKTRHLKLVLENKIDSPETNDQTWKYYIYFSNNAEECLDKGNGKSSITPYKIKPHRYQPSDVAEIQLFVLLSPDIEKVVSRSPRGICKYYIRISYQDLYEEVFKEVYRSLPKDLDKRKQYYVASYMHNLSSPVLSGTDKYKEIIVFEKEDMKDLKTFWTENLPLFKMAAEAVRKDSTDAEEIENISNIMRSIRVLNRRYKYYTLTLPDGNVYDGLRMKEAAQKVVSYLLRMGIDSKSIKNLLPESKWLQTPEEYFKGQEKSTDNKYQARRDLINDKYYLSNQWTVAKYSYFIKKLNEQFPEINIYLKEE